MEGKTFLILGGYGNTGILISHLLLQESGARLVLAGRTIENADAAAAQLNSRFEGGRVTTMYADASDVASLTKALEGVDFIIVASSSSENAELVARAALEAGVDYLDIQYSTKKTAVLKAMAGEITDSGYCFITDGGFHPGLPGALIRYVAQFFDHMETAIVGSVIKVDWASLSMSDATVYEFMEEICSFEALVFKGDQWVKASMQGMMEYITMDFGGNFGNQYCAPMFLEEMRPIPDMYPSLSKTGFFVGGFNWFVDWLVFPVSMLGLRLSPNTARAPLAKLMKWGLDTFSKPPYGTVLKVEARGEKESHDKAVNVSIHHEDGYMLTAIPVIACLLQYLDGSLRKPGLWTQANIVEPNRLMTDMERLGVDVRIEGDIGAGE
jgi:saccharopine dehydrogenase (NAD+, L-lysine-forming)